MCCEKNEENIYNATINTSKEMSLQKAIAIFMEEQEKNTTVLIRPALNPKRGIIKILAVLLLLGVMGVLFAVFDISLMYVFLSAFLVAVLNVKKMVIWLVLLYQKYAPERLRRSCVFEPTCSNYMLAAIDKYGLVKGLTKGIIRLFRCHPPNGGIDNP